MDIIFTEKVLIYCYVKYIFAVETFFTIEKDNSKTSENIRTAIISYSTVVKLRIKPVSETFTVCITYCIY